MEGLARIIPSQPLCFGAAKPASGGKIRAPRFASAKSSRKPLNRFRKTYPNGRTRVGACILANTIGNSIAGSISQSNNTAAQGQTGGGPTNLLAQVSADNGGDGTSPSPSATTGSFPIGMGPNWVPDANGSWFNQGAVNAAVDRIAASSLVALGIDTTILAPELTAAGSSVFQGIAVPNQSQAEAQYAQIEISECKTDPIFSNFLSNKNTISMNNSMISDTNSYNITQNVNGVSSVIHPEYEYIAGPSTFTSGYDYSSLMTSHSNSSVNLSFSIDAYALLAGVNIATVPADQILIVHDHPGPNAMPGLSYGKGDDGQGSDIQTANSTGHSIIAYDFSTKQYYCYNPSGTVKLK